MRLNRQPNVTNWRLSSKNDFEPWEEAKTQVRATQTDVKVVKMRGRAITEPALDGKRGQVERATLL